MDQGAGQDVTGTQQVLEMVVNEVIRPWCQRCEEEGVPYTQCHAQLISGIVTALVPVLHVLNAEGRAAMIALIPQQIEHELAEFDVSGFVPFTGTYQ